MTMKITGEDGQEIEVYTAAEVQERETAAATAKEAEFTPKIADLSEKLTDAETRAKERAGQFAHFRKLNDEQVAKLTVAERTIYENGLALNEEREKNVKIVADQKKANIEAAITLKAGTDEKLKTKMTEMWTIMGLADDTPDQIEQKSLAVLGAIGTTQPDLVAGIGGFSGSFAPPGQKVNQAPSFADTPAGKAGAKELGLEIPEQK